MHNIYDCVDSFSSLLDTEYRLILGRKGEAVSLNITFDKKDCFHLMGLQYLTDRPELSRDRGKIFDEIKARVLTKEQIESSDLYEQIADRIDCLHSASKHAESPFLSAFFRRLFRSSPATQLEMTYLDDWIQNPVSIVTM